jgi:hypothetical protein
MGREKFLNCDFFNYIKIKTNGKVKKTISKQAAIVKLLAPENNSH